MPMSNYDWSRLASEKLCRVCVGGYNCRCSGVITSNYHTVRVGQHAFKDVFITTSAQHHHQPFICIIPYLHSCQSRACGGFVTIEIPCKNLNIDVSINLKANLLFLFSTFQTCFQDNEGKTCDILKV